MTELVNVISLSNYFIQFVIFIILIGILFLEYFGKRKNKKGIIGFIIISVSITIFVALDTYRFFSGINTKVFLMTLMAMNIFQLSFLIINAIYVRKHINWKLFFGIPIFVLGLISFEYLISFFFHQRLEVLNVLAMGGASILYYFLIIKLIITINCFNISTLFRFQRYHDIFILASYTEQQTTGGIQRILNNFKLIIKNLSYLTKGFEGSFEKWGKRPLTIASL